MTLLDVQPRTRGHRAAGSDFTPLPAITAWGTVTPFGNTAETWRGLLEGRFIEDHARLDAPGPRDCPRVVRLARAAVDELKVQIPPDTALVVGTSKGSVDAWMAGRFDPAGLADIAGRLAEPLRLRGPRLTVSAACASGLHALIRGSLMIRSGEAKRVLVVASEASVHDLFIASFARLGVVPKPGIGCRPFDERRGGFLMSEAAAAVLLEAHDPDGGAVGSDDNGDVSPLLIENTALGGDATHLTGGDPDGTLLRTLIRRVLANRPVDFVHAHGTGTVANDPIELTAVEQELSPGNHPPVYSHKAALGHSLGAAGLLAVALSCQIHTTGTIPGNVRTEQPLSTHRVTIDRGSVRRPIQRSLVVCAGFGGATAAVTLRSL